jgi:multiple sugar transport system substrate-binding protein
MTKVTERVRWTVVAACTGALVGGGCGSDAPGMAADGGAVTITFLRHDNPNYTKADRAYFDQYQAAHPNVKIADTTVPFITLAAELNGNLKRDAFTYDLVLIPPSWVCSLAAHLGDVPAEVATLSEAQNTFFAAPLEGSVCGGRLKALPVEYNLEYGGVVVNLDKYEAKFPGKTPAWASWSAFIAEAAALTEYDPAGKPMANGLDIDPDWYEPFKHIFLSQILQRGGSYWSATGDTFDFSTPQAHDSLAAIVGWLAMDKVMFRQLVPDKNTGLPQRLAAGATGYGWSDPAKPLSVMGYAGTWAVPSTVAALPMNSTWRFDFFALPPMVGDEHKFIQNSGWAFAVPNTSKNPKVAWDVARSLALSPDAMRQWSAITGALPALRVNGSASAAMNQPVLAKVQPLLDNGRWVGFIPTGAIENVLATMVSNFFAAVAGSKTVDQALMDMQRVANDEIVRHRGD